MFSHPFPGALETFLRLAAAVGVGSLLGLNRELHGKPAGLRTHALVTLGSALATLTILRAGGPFGTADALSRVIQGIITGIGFLGAGVILRDNSGRVRGLTTAATIWVAAALGIACGAAYWPAILSSLLLIFLVLIFGRPVERLSDALFKKAGKRAGIEPPPPDPTAGDA